MTGIKRKNFINEIVGLIENVYSAGSDRDRANEALQFNNMFIMARSRGWEQGIIDNAIVKEGQKQKEYT